MADGTNFVIGVDFGTDSVRALLVDAADGSEISGAVAPYRRWKSGLYCDPAANRFRQHPLDYLEGLEEAVRQSLAGAPPGTAAAVRGISVDTTGSTPAAVDKQGNPLALNSGFEENPDAMFVLWKDHTSVAEAEEINTLARSWGGVDFTRYVGGVYSSEWFWAKMLHVMRANRNVREAAFSWAEHCDWIPALLTGKKDPRTWMRSRCAAGHKAMWHPSFGGLPSADFLGRLDPSLAAIRERLYERTYTNDVCVGALSPEWAERLGLHTGVRVGIGAIDAHMGAIGGEIAPYQLTKIMGTSTCDMLIVPSEEIGERPIRGICGQVDGSIIPGMLAMEAGQSAFGDAYAWFRDLLAWPLLSPRRNGGDNVLTPVLENLEAGILPELSDAAAQLPIDEGGIVALDWLNGRRTPDANQMLKGAITGLSLGSDAPRIFRALVEATAFGARRIVDRFREEGVRIDGVIALGGVPKKSPFIMQVVADVLNMPISVPRCEQACALGAAMCAAAVAGIYPSIEEARRAMGSGFEKEYRPVPANVAGYERLYQRYLRLAEIIEKESVPQDLSRS